MPQTSKNNQPQRTELNEDLLKAIIEQQSKKLQLDEQRLKLEEKRVDQDGKLAEQSLRFNSELLKDSPNQTRKTLTRLAWIIGIPFFLVLGILTLWMYMGKDELVYTCLKGGSYIATSVISFIIGQKSKSLKQEKAGGIEEAEVLED